MSRAGLCAVGLAALVVAAPLGRGGTSGTAMALLHSLVLAAAWIALRLRTPAFGERPPAAVLLAAAFALWSAAGIPAAGYRFAAMGAAWDMAMIVLTLWAAWTAGGATAVRRWLPVALLLSAAAQSAVALGQHWVRDGLRGSGSFLNPNHLAAYLNLAICLAAGRLVARRGRDPLALTALVPIAAAQLFGVASRGALLALGLVALGAAWSARHRLLSPIGGGHRRRAVAVAALVALVGLAGLAGVSRRFSGPEDPYRHARLRIWPASLAAAAEAPIRGMGPGMFEHRAERYNFPVESGPVRYGKRFHTTHSQYLEVLVETGAVGLALFLAALAAGLHGIRARRSADADQGFGAGALAGLWTLLLQGVGEPMLATPGIALPAAAIAGAALSAPVQPVPRPPRLGPGLRLAATGVAIGTIWVGLIAPWLADRHYGRMLQAEDGETFRRELSLALRFNPMQPYYYSRAAEAILRSVPRLELASYAICYDYAAKAVRLNPSDPRLLLLQADVNRRAFEEVFNDPASLEEALESYEAAVRAAPTDPVPAAARAGFLLDLGRDAEALGSVERALSIEPNFVRARRMRAEVLRRLGRIEEAAAVEGELEALRRELEGYRPRNGYEAMVLELRGSDRSGSSRGGGRSGAGRG